MDGQNASTNRLFGSIGNGLATGNTGLADVIGAAQESPLEKMMNSFPDSGEQAQSKSSFSTIGDLFSSGGQAPINNSKLQTMLNQIGLGEIYNTLTASPFGKIQLVNSLQEKFGPQWSQNPYALQVLSSYNSFMKQNEDDINNAFNNKVKSSKATIDKIMQGLI